MFPNSELFTCCLGSILNFYVKIKVLIRVMILARREHEYSQIGNPGNLIVFGIIAIILLLLLICMAIQKSNSCHPESAEPSNEKKNTASTIYDLFLKKPKGSNFSLQRWYALQLL